MVKFNALYWTFDTFLKEEKRLTVAKEPYGSIFETNNSVRTSKNFGFDLNHRFFFSNFRTLAMNK